MRAQAFFYCFLMMSVLLLPACATTKNAVPLMHPQLSAEEVPAASAPKVCIVLFDDTRGTPVLGMRSDGTSFTPTSDVRLWVTRGLAAELTRLGAQATVASTMDETKKSGAAFIVYGIIEEITLTENSSTSYSCGMRSSIRIVPVRGKQTYSSSYNANLSKQVLLNSEAPQEILSETLRDLLSPMAQEIIHKVGS